MRGVFFYTFLGFSCLINVQSAPLEISNGNNHTVDEPVMELESLKPRDNKPLQISLSAAQSSVFSDVNGRRQGHSEKQNQMNKNGELIAKVSQKTDLSQESEKEPPKAHTQIELDIPSEGIHRSTERDEQPDVALAKMNSISRLEYSPMDMAEYVFWTGDEKGVTLAIEDFLREGLLTREEAIIFLQAIKSNLENIQAHYQGLQKMEEKIANKLQRQLKMEENKKLTEENMRKSLIEAMRAREVADKEIRDESIEEKKKRADGEEYDDMQERTKDPEENYNDYPLEEVIYQLAKMMFSQSLNQGSSHAHQALRRFTDYLEKEVEYGRISRQIEKKILAALVTALSDTLRERPDLLAAATEGLSNMNERRNQRLATLSEPRQFMERRSSPAVMGLPMKRTKKFRPFAPMIREHEPLPNENL